LAGVLLDTHALYWLVSGEEQLSNDALIAIGESQEMGNLFVSPITAWELSLAARKRLNAPQLGTGSAGKWFRDAVRAVSAKVVPISQRIAIESAEVVATTGHKDPGDCYLIATARIKGIPIVSRDSIMLGMAASPGYLTVIQC
jgi:PIN domain nuclease of toxin-antitoxin system